MEAKKSHITLPESLKDLPKDYAGYVVISDIDKTYLATQIDSIGGLLKTALETAEAKDNIPGFSIVLRALRRGAAAEAQQNPIYFVSASPPQMQATLMAKMELDGIEHNGIVFKDQMQHVRRRDFKKLKEQIGYKLEALLLLWLSLPHSCKLILFGDDSESDPAIYSLFCDILGGVVRGPELRNLLVSLGVFSEEGDKILELADRLRDTTFPVEFAFINLVTGSQAAYYSRFGPHFFATENSLQIALTLFEKNLIRERAVRSIGRDLALYYDFSPQRLLESLKVGALRGLYGYETLRKLWTMLAQARVLPDPQASDLE
ncbi:MAG: phosphatase domain-containing protein, partial [Bdellovibrionota bacterium]